MPNKLRIFNFFKYYHSQKKVRFAAIYSFLNLIPPPLGVTIFKLFCLGGGQMTYSWHSVNWGITPPPPLLFLAKSPLKYANCPNPPLFRQSPPYIGFS